MSALAALGLESGQLRDLGLQGGEARLEGSHVSRGGAVLVVDDVGGGVLHISLEVLGPVEEVVHEVLGVVDDVFDEPSNGVLALGHEASLVLGASNSPGGLRYA